MNVKKFVVPGLLFLVMAAAGAGGAAMIQRRRQPAPADSTGTHGASDSTHTVATASDSTAARDTAATDTLASMPAADSSALVASGPSAFGPSRGAESHNAAPGSTPAPAVTTAGTPAPAILQGSPGTSDSTRAGARGAASGAQPDPSSIRRMLETRTPGTIAIADPRSPAPQNGATSGATSGARLTMLLGKMPARDAAKVLELLDDTEIGMVLSQLGDRQAAQVLTALPPARSAAIMRASLRPAASSRSSSGASVPAVPAKRGGAARGGAQ